MPITTALGMVLLGSSTSSAGIVEISKPAYAQKIKTIAEPKPANPNGANGEKLAKATLGLIIIQLNPAMTKKTSGAILSNVKASLTLPAALTPIMLVTARKATNNTLIKLSVTMSRLGTKNIRYLVKAKGKTASEIHSASHSDQPTMKPAKVPKRV